MRVPTRSDGIRSGVNWMRVKVPLSVLASVDTVSVLPRPGTPSSRQWPLARRATSTRSSTRSWPTMTRRISNSTCSSAAPACATDISPSPVAGGFAAEPSAAGGTAAMTSVDASCSATSVASGSVVATISVVSITAPPRLRRRP